MSIEAESQPNMRPTPPDERDELALLEAKVARKQIEVNGATNFGKFDSVASNEGEVNYKEYLENRPNDGVIRDGEGHRDVKSGQFASQADYLEQTAPKNEILDMLNNPGEEADLDYESKSRTELIKLAADAKELGDRAEVEDIKAAFEHNLMEEFTREIGAGMTEEDAEAERLRYADTDRTDEQFNAELAAFDAAIDKMLALRNQKNNTETVSAEGVEKDGDSAETKAEVKLNIGDRVTYKNKRSDIVTGNISAVIELDNEEYMIFGVETEDGSINYVSYAELVANANASGAAGELTGDELEGGGEKGPTTELSFGNYPELYAQRKNLMSTVEGREKLEAEGKEVAKNLTDYVTSKLADFMEHNPDASEDQIRQATMGFYLEANNNLEKEIIDHIDGVKVDGHETKGAEGALRRFGAWMDRHGNKIKIGLLVAGGIGLAATGIGLAAGGITIGVAASAGTALGAIKGTAIGTLLQRQGSKRSAVREVDLSQGETAKDLTANLDSADRETFETYSAWIMSQYDSAADQDHAKNVKRTTTAAIVGGALGAMAGSLHIDTITSHDVTTSVEIPNSASEVVSHQIAPGELSGQVLDKLFADNKIDISQFLQTHNIVGQGNSFALSDGSTNIGLIHAVENALGPDFGVIGQTHSFAGADALSNDGIRSIFEAIHNNVDWGSHSVSTTTTVNGSEINWPWTIATAGSASLVGDSVAKLVGDIERRRQKPLRVSR
ncbi:MAG TPA: hypothetical protein PK265_00545 [Candidatus Saccharibacteria bacterium]|nr:hypothetical protein [Candidatus Saccharibacteria bacterium]HRQ97802.1 hypothetical protein [Candidatus Saccharibacteria bacterium]